MCREASICNKLLKFQLSRTYEYEYIEYNLDFEIFSDYCELSYLISRGQTGCPEGQRSR